MQNVRTQGTVAWYDPRKGYGYATRKDAPEVFLHYGAITANVIELRPGQKVEFVLEQTPRGAVAHDIQPI